MAITSSVVGLSAGTMPSTQPSAPVPTANPSPPDTFVPLRRRGRVPLPDEVMNQLEFMNTRLNGVLADLANIRYEMNILNDRLLRALLLVESIDEALHNI
jgi:hypothetical protein